MQFLVAALLVLAAVANANDYFGSSVYKYLSSQKYTNAQAVTACKAFGPTWDLASIHSQEENDFIYAYGPQSNILKWIGGYRNRNLPLSATAFTWSDGTAWGYTAFASVTGEPNDKVAPENCVQTGHSQAAFGPGEWNDAPCSNRNFAVCKRAQVTCSENIVSDHIVTYNGLNELDTASVSCSNGFTQTGTANYVCSIFQGQGLWVLESGQTTFSCDPVPCPSAPAVATNGFTTTTSGVFGDSASLECNTGYTGSQSVLCQADGTWEATTYTCEIVQCPVAPVVPTNGWTATTSGVFGDSASLACASGYTGSQTVLCQADGTWETTTYTCDPVPCPVAPVVPTNGWTATTSGVFGDSAVITCNSGYQVIGYVASTSDSASGVAAQIVSCQADGTWEATSITCEPVPCPATPVVPANGWTATTSGVFGDFATLSCASGYTGSQVVFCQADGTWETTTYTCDPVPCPSAPGVPTNGWTATTSGVFGDSATLSCAAGYTGSQTVLCQADGTWEATTYTCTPVPCPSAPGVPTNAWTATTSGVFGDSAVISCNIGYEAASASSGSDSSSGSASEVVLCQADGTWEAATITCVPVPCPVAPVLPTNGWTATTSGVFGDSASLSCAAGYTGSQSVVCQADGTWEATTYTCTPVSCNSAPVAATNGFTTTTSGVFGDSASLECNSGYTGSQSVLCQADGTWETTTYTCDPVPCPSAPAVATNGWTATTSGVFGDSASLECNSGYTGSQSVLCQADGTWEATTYTCAPVDCGLLNLPTNGDAVYTGTTFGETATTSCTSGNFYGEDSYTCQADGTWSPGCFTCVADSIFGDYSYRYLNPLRTQIQAKDACRALGFGWDLASIHSEDENSFAYALQPNIRSLRWIGGERVNGAWTWSDGTDFDYDGFNTASGEPNNLGGNEHCVQQGHRLVQFADGKWNDARCALKRQAICKKAIDLVC